AVGCLVVTRLVALGDLAPRRHRMTIAAGAAAKRVIDGVHRLAAYIAEPAKPARTPRFADEDVLLIGVGHRANGGHAFGAHHAHLARGEPQQRITRVATH